MRLPTLTMVCATGLLLSQGAWAQSEQESVGRGWPVSSTDFAYVSGGAEGAGDQTVYGGAAPEGIEPLEVDLFTTTDFYQDADLWSDPRYFRCNSPSTLQAMWGGGSTGDSLSTLIGDNPPMSA